jgi:RNA polymerase primary sigma factor
MARTHVPHAGPQIPNAASSSPTDCVSAVSERRQRLVQENLGFVIKVASEYRNLGLPVEDLISEGSLGLIEAAVRYDPGRGAKFVTYAAAWVRKSILRALSQNTRTIRIPPYHQDQLKRYQRAEALLSFQLGRRPDRAEVSRRLDSPGARVDALLTSRITEVSLEGFSGQGSFDSPLGRVEDPRAGNPERDLMQDESQHLLEEALSALSARERRIIVARFGLESGERASLRELGGALGLSRERVRQIEAGAKEKIRRHVERKALCRRSVRGIMRPSSSSARRSGSPRAERGGGDLPG